MTLDEINQMDRASFVAALGGIYEHSPWVADRAWPWRPFRTIDALRSSIAGQVAQASTEQQLALIRAHPDLGARAKMSDASAGEQAGAGLDRLTAEEFDRLQRLNSEYKERF